MLTRILSNAKFSLSKNIICDPPPQKKEQKINLRKKLPL